MSFMIGKVIRGEGYMNKWVHFSLMGALLGIYSTPCAHAIVGSMVQTSDRFEVCELSWRGSTIVKFDKATGDTYYLWGNLDHDDPWELIRNDEVSKPKARTNEVNFQIYSSPSITILYNVHDGSTWYLTQGPTGYRLMWKKTK